MDVLQLIALVGVGTAAGVYVGAIPGLSGTMAVSLLVSFTFGWQTAPALALMVGVFVGAVFGGSRSAILLNIPGAPAAVATGLDGYPLAKKGMAGRAMGIATTQSFVGTLVGALALAFGAPIVSRLALGFTSVDYLVLGLVGLTTVGGLAGKSMGKGIACALLGLFFGTVGLDSMTAVPRFTMGSTLLLGGVRPVAAMIGLFGISQALWQVAFEKDVPLRQQVDKILPDWATALRHLPLTLRCSLLGVAVGALPGAGGEIAALLAYHHAQKTVKHPSAPFGEGAVEGIIAPEAANNAAVGGALIPMLTLGIPGDAVTAVLIGAMAVHGVRPGPDFITRQPELFWLIVASLFAAAFFLLIFGLTGIRLFARVTEIPPKVLAVLVLVLSVVGAYAVGNSMVDVGWAMAFGFLGYVLRRYEYPVAPLVLGLILCPMLEENFRRGILLGGSFFGLLLQAVRSPMSLCMIFLLGWMLRSAKQGDNGQ